MNTKTTNLRIRLTDEELANLDTVRQFLGLKSVSAAAARLCTWNARILGETLRSDDASAGASAIGDVVGEATKLALQKLILDGFCTPK